MILKGFHVGGFGVHRDLRYEAGPGLNVVDGPNEAGKTTLHDFVRGMLFGFRGRDAFHQPLQGGGPGGWLEVEGPEGPIRIERKGPGKKDLRVILPGGAAGGQGDLDALLRRTDAQLFRNVFAFGLDELAGFSILTGPEMEMRLFDSSLSGAGRSASALKARLDAIRKEELSARKGTIRERAAEIGELERQLESAKARGRRHGDLAARERRIGEEIEVAQERRREARARADRFTALVDLWDEEVRRREAEAALVELVPLADARERLAGVEALAAVLQREEGLQRERRQRLETLENAAGEKRAAAIRLLESLGPSWTEARARAVDRSLPRRQRFEALAETLRRAERSHAAARNDLEAATREASRAAANLAEVNEAVAALKAPASTQELVDRGGALAELRAARADREHAARRLEDLRDRRGSAGAVSGGAKTLPAWLGAALFAAAGAVAWIAGEPLAAVLAVCAAMALAGLAVWSRTGRRDPGRLEDPVRAAEAALRVLDGAIAAHAAAVGIEGTPTAAAVEAADFALQRERALRERWDALQREREMADRRWRAAADAESMAAEVASAAWGALATAAGGWNESVCDLVDPEDVLGSGSVAPFSVASVSVASGSMASGSGVTGSQPWGESGAADDRLARDPKAALSPDAALARLSRIESAVGALDAAARDAEERSILREAAARWERRVESLLEPVGMAGAGEAGLSTLGQALERVREVREATRAIEARLGADADAAREELAGGDRIRWEEERARAAEDEKAHAEEVARLTEARALQRKEREDLELSADVPRLAAGLDRSRTLLAEAVRRWRRATLLDRLLHAALDGMRRERQPAVLRQAGEAFAVVTAGRYASVEQSFDGEGIVVVEAATGARLPASALSRGTREQLFVCVRLGLAAAFADTGTRLPLLLDDVFVNFDPTRAEATARVVARFAQAHQVFVFTCHPQTVERLRVAEPAASVLTLGRRDLYP